ncbi:adenylate/guanylate cyclase domain-containing protein [Mesorhizobium sp. KR9-304]|uniref:adenylate/guanylate cyclase domain-containing protein n=1 Tax=Mesorhizobium sp. KR9-304 TaxID=3156614 RepID=UPI0032B45CAF
MTPLQARYQRWLIPLLGARATKAMPTQVAAAIQEQENRGEVLAKIVQLIIAAVWGALYLLSPQLRTNDFLLIPLAVGTYMVVNGLLLFWATRRRLPNWTIYFSIVFDMALLYFVIWRFHVLLDQPPSFYLKAPTVTFVFVFIALRALRFDPRFVLVAGVAAVAGWIAMVGYAIFGDPAGVHIARNFVEYATGDAVLPGAELEKILAMMLVTGIIGLSLYRGRVLLIRATTETMAARRLSRFFDSSVVEDIRSGENAIAPGEGRAREAAILNVDIRGFSRLIENLPPSDAISMLTAYQRRVVPIIQANGGVIDKFMGDGIMATFGAVRPSDTYAADALRTVDAILADTDLWGDDASLSQLVRDGIGLSVSAGPIIFGAVGDSDRMEVTVIGSTVNVAAKLEKANKIFDSAAVVTRSTFDAAIGQGYVPARMPRFMDVDVELEGLAPGTALAVWSRRESLAPSA